VTKAVGASGDQLTEIDLKSHRRRRGRTGWL